MSAQINRYILRYTETVLIRTRRKSIATQKQTPYLPCPITLTVPFLQLRHSALAAFVPSFSSFTSTSLTILAHPSSIQNNPSPLSHSLCFLPALKSVLPRSASLISVLPFTVSSQTPHHSLQFLAFTRFFSSLHPSHPPSHPLLHALAVSTHSLLMRGKPACKPCREWRGQGI